MDVHADDAGISPDPSATAVFERPVSGGLQQQLFADAYPTYADTDKIPAVGKAGSVRAGYDPSGSARALRVAIVIVALAVLAGGAALGLVKTGVIGTGTNTGPGSASSPAPPVHHGTVAVPTSPLLTPISSGAGTASYRIDIAAYAVTVATSTGRSWVSIGIIGQHPIYAGILLAILGSGLAAGQLRGALAFLVALVALLFKSRAEERVMEREFGERYAAYRARSWALVPFLY